MDNESDEVRLTLRLPRALYERILKLTRGDGRRPVLKVNPTLVWLLEKALDAVEEEPGQLVGADAW